MADGREAHVFATEGFRIRNRWTPVQLSAHVARALQSGDLEELGPGDRALTPAEIAAKYGAGTIERAAEKPEQSVDKPREQSVEPSKKKMTGKQIAGLIDGVLDAHPTKGIGEAREEILPKTGKSLANVARDHNRYGRHKGKNARKGDPTT
jgi:hypothetical protein